MLALNVSESIQGTPWTADVKQKISERTKAAMARPEIRERLGQSATSGRRGHSQSQETREKIRQSLKQRHLKKREDNIARLITEGLSRFVLLFSGPVYSK